MSKQIYIFNPEHDLCIANGDENFVPPRSALGFAKDNVDLSEYLKRPNKQLRQIIPWGWNHALKKRLINEGIDPAALPSETELQFIRTHSRREFALDVQSRLNCSESHVIGPDYRIVARSVSEIDTFLSDNGSAVLKSPLSGSGKGIRFVRERLSESDKGWCRRTLDKQGAVIVEQRLEIIKECAMLFECHHEGIDFIGYSLFESKNGAYSRNILASNEDIEEIIARYISLDTLTDVRESLQSILSDTLVGHYEGFLGVDQMICQPVSPIFVPVSEINLRMTMGLIARNAFCFQCQMLHNYNEEACKNEVCKNSQERNGEERTSETISEGDEDDAGTNFSSCEHTNAKGKDIGKKTVRCVSPRLSIESIRICRRPCRSAMQSIIRLWI